MSQQTPTIGATVHYVSYGTPGGEYASRCRAAIVTGQGEPLAHPTPGAGPDDLPEDGAQLVDLCVLNPTGLFFNPGCPQDEGGETAGSPDCAAAATHGNPFRYCACGWAEVQYVGGTWHWPERA